MHDYDRRPFSGLAGTVDAGISGLTLATVKLVCAVGFIGPAEPGRNLALAATGRAHPEARSA